MIWVLLAVAVALAVVAVWVLFERRWRRRQPLTPDHCRTCDRQLHRGEVWELRSGHREAEDGVGGTFLAITYCPRHKPKGAVRG